MSTRRLWVLVCLSIGCGGGGHDPGSLVAVTTSGKVGVLLDEYPAAARADIADQLVAETDDVWKARAVLQLRLTNLRLVYRGLYYDEAEAKNALALPPEDVWDITLDFAGAQRTTEGGHDLVAVDYTWSSTLLS